MKSFVFKLVLFSCLWITNSNGQNNYASSYDWEKTPTVVNVDSLKFDSDWYYVLDYQFDEFNKGEEDGSKSVFVGKHLRYKILTQSGKERGNSLEVSLKGVKEIVTLKARTISKNGSIKELGINEIKSVENYEDSGDDYKIFAFEELEIGSEIEVLYIFEKSEPRIYGYKTLQWKFPILNSKYTLIYPVHLSYRTALTDQNIKVSQDTILFNEDKYIKHTFSLENVKGLKEERYGNINPYLAKVKFCLDENLAKRTSNLYSNKYYSHELYSKYFPETLEPSKSAKKAIKKVVLEGDRTQQAKAIENWAYLNLKTISSVFVENFALTKGLKFSVETSGKSSLEDAFKGEMCTDETKIMATIDLFKAAGFKVELVFSCDREDNFFEKAFDTPMQLDGPLIYLPEIKYFCSPLELGYKNGFFPSGFFTQNGMFIKQNCVGEFCNGVSYISSIGSLAAETTQNKLEAKLHFEEDFSQTVVDLTSTLSGYFGKNEQISYYFAEDEDKKKMVKNNIEYMLGEDYEGESTVENATINDVFIKPFVIKGTYKSSSLTETAGDKHIVLVGNIIGQQSELYSETKRTLPVTITYNHIFDRSIVVEVPSGYRLSNLNELKNVSIVSEHNGVRFATFDVKYEMVGSDLKIVILEVYSQINVDLEGYDDFAKVINASADFNKVKLIFVKE
jgi:hypothetical protein